VNNVDVFGVVAAVVHRRGVIVVELSSGDDGVCTSVACRQQKTHHMVKQSKAMKLNV
jgi:hypothetical protein